MSVRLLVAGLTAALLGAGCATQRGSDTSATRPPAPVAVPAPAPVLAPVVTARPGSDSDKLLLYFEHLRKLSAAELTKEHDTVRQILAKSGTDVLRVRYAMLLSVPGATFADDTRALETLEPLLKNPDAALHNLAYLLSAQIQEQRRGQGLQQKLEALKSLEKNLIERDPGAGKRK